MAKHEQDAREDDSLWRWWPAFIGGFCGPLLAHVLVEWMPAYLAVGAAFFVMWVVVGLVFTALPPTRRWSLLRWTGAGALGAIIAAALAFVVHWS